MLMRLLIIALSIFVFVAGRAVAEEKAGAEKVPTGPATVEKQKMSDKEKLSYSYGYEIGKNLKKQFGDVNPDIIARGIADAINGKQAAMGEAEMRETLAAFRTKNNNELAEKNKKEGETFLAENKKKEGIVTLPSGLQYKVIKEGAGRTPNGNEKVRVHYFGKFIDGTEFANTYKEGDQGPWIVYVNDVIPGWSEALKLMKVGSKWEIFIPSNLAYGERGNPPNAVLIYELELLSIH